MSLVENEEENEFKAFAFCGRIVPGREHRIFRTIEDLATTVAATSQLRYCCFN